MVQVLVKVVLPFAGRITVLIRWPRKRKRWAPWRGRSSHLRFPLPALYVKPASRTTSRLTPHRRLWRLYKQE